MQLIWNCYEKKKLLTQTFKQCCGADPDPHEPELYPWIRIQQKIKEQTNTNFISNVEPVNSGLCTVGLYQYFI